MRAVAETLAAPRTHLSVEKQKIYMSLLTQELAEQELARSSIAEEADEWI